MVMSIKDNFIEWKKELNLDIDDTYHIRTLSIEDICDDYINWMNDSEVVKYTEQRFYKHSLKDIQKFVEDKINSPADILFGVFCEGFHIGNIKLGPINWMHENAEVSYLIGNKKFWGRGIATSVVKTVVDFGFNELDLKKINAGYYEDNAGSAKVLKKCGFIVEGVRKKDVILESKRVSAILVGLIR